MIDLEYWQELEHRRFMAALIQARLVKNMTVNDVAAAAGEPDVWAEAFESDDYDPPLSSLRRYARAIGVAFQIGVHPAEQPEESD